MVTMKVEYRLSGICENCPYHYFAIPAILLEGVWNTDLPGRLTENSINELHRFYTQNGYQVLYCKLRRVIFPVPGTNGCVYPRNVV